MEKLKGSLFCKLVALLLLTAAVFIAALSVAAAVMMFDRSIYTTPEAVLRDSVFEKVSKNYANELSEYYRDAASTANTAFTDYNFDYLILDADAVTVADTRDALADYADEYTHNIHYYGYYGDRLNSENITIYVKSELAEQDNFRFADTLVRTAYSMKYAVYFIALITAVAALLLFAFLMSAAGHKAGSGGEITLNPFDKIPFDISLALFITAVTLGFCFYDGYHIYEFAMGDVIFAAVFVLVTLPAFVGLCMTFSTRIKSGGGVIWRNTVIFMALRLVWKAFAFLWRLLVRFKNAVAGFFRNASLSPLFTASAAVLTAVELFFLLVFMGNGEPGMMFFVWFLHKLLVLPAAAYAVASFKKLKRGAEAIARGDLNAPVEKNYAFADFRQFAECLSGIGGGLNAAVEERLKSETTKTELITNVSHDIKTPLTSIINYAGLLEREETDNEKIKEYTAVISRQSARLKKLTDDLVEASRAAAGSVEVNFAPCELGTLLDQTSAEYQTRLEDAGLTLILNKPETAAAVRADGRLLWRVFDNLMSNVCKYSLRGTRVYVDLRIIGGRVAVSFRNISNYPLNITPEELTERFVRGDESRNSDGSGLGLSIAKSLTELQNGTFSIQIDGDLFKALVTFERLTEAE